MMFTYAFDSEDPDLKNSWHLDNNVDDEVPLTHCSQRKHDVEEDHMVYWLVEARAKEKMNTCSLQLDEDAVESKDD